MPDIAGDSCITDIYLVEFMRLYSPNAFAKSVLSRAPILVLTVTSAA